MWQRLVLVILVAAAFAVTIAPAQAHGDVLADVVVEVIEDPDPDPGAAMSAVPGEPRRSILALPRLRLAAPAHPLAAPPPVPPPER